LQVAIELFPPPDNEVTAAHVLMEVVATANASRMSKPSSTSASTIAQTGAGVDEPLDAEAGEPTTTVAVEVKPVQSGLLDLSCEVQHVQAVRVNGHV